MWTLNEQQENWYSTETNARDIRICAILTGYVCIYVCAIIISTIECLMNWITNWYDLRNGCENALHWISYAKSSQYTKYTRKSTADNKNMYTNMSHPPHTFDGPYVVISDNWQRMVFIIVQAFSFVVHVNSHFTTNSHSLNWIASGVISWFV